ncbi:MAG: hypothetical protein NZM00_12315, partial [Anaerolinea sp.]|nr:hypothetical protein [Anaerolinea sp.]
MVPYQIHHLHGEVDLTGEHHRLSLSPVNLSAVQETGPASGNGAGPAADGASEAASEQPTAPPAH